MKINIPFHGRYDLTNEEWSDIAERELPQEAFYQDGELNETEALDYAHSLYKLGEISRATLAWYEIGRHYDGEN
jgi:hypothetical protein